jgi:hypothetical protein
MTKEKAKRASNLLYKLEDVEVVIDKIMHIEELPQDLYQELIQIVYDYKHKTEKELDEL